MFYNNDEESKRTTIATEFFRLLDEDCREFFMIPSIAAGRDMRSIIN